MRNIRIYQAGNYTLGEQLTLLPAQSQHVSVVLRMQPGNNITLFSGDNREFTARIVSLTNKKVTVLLTAENYISRESPRNIHLAQAVSKQERMEFVVQKAVELGVASITPVLTQRCVLRLDTTRMQKKIEHWQAIAIAACEQCGRNQLPHIAPLYHLPNYLQLQLDAAKFVLLPQATKTWRNYCFDAGNIVLLVGPEGGFSEQECSESISVGFQPLSLGPRILRTETAAIAALSLLQALGGDL